MSIKEGIQSNTEPASSVNKKKKIESKFATEFVDLPSKGLLYPEDHPLRSGKIEMKYMTTKEEDILSTPSYISSGVVLDKLFQSMIVTKFNYNDLLLGDRNAVMIWARILGYGNMYSTNLIKSDGSKQSIELNLMDVKNKPFQVDEITSGNLFKFTLPKMGNVIEFKLLTVGMQKDIGASIAASRKHEKVEDKNLTTRLRYMIQSIDGIADRSMINQFIPTILATDSRALREYIQKIQPDVDLSVEAVDETTGQPFQTNFQLGLDLFWPDYQSD